MNKRKFVLALLAAAVGSLFLMESSWAVPEPDDPGILKRITGGRQSVSTKVYKLVRFANRGPNALVDSGDVLVWDTVSDDGVAVSLTTTSADGAIAGIAVTQIESADSASSSAADDDGRRNWGYIIVHGVTAADASSGGHNSANVGDPFVTSVDSGAITTLQDRATGAPTNTAGVRNGLASGGFYLDTPGVTDTSVQVFVRLE